MKRYPLRFLFAFATIALSIHAEEQTSPISPLEAREILIPSTQGVILVSKASDIMTSGMGHIRGLQIKDLKIPGDLEELKKILEPLFLNKPLTQTLLIEIKRQIILYYRNHDHPVVTVEVPEQDITEGVVQLIVIEGKLGQVICKGNKWFKNDLIQSFLNIDSGDAISFDTLLNDVAWMNRNPFRRTDILFTPGAEQGTTDIELITQDRRPARLYAGYDNTGNQPTGENRWYAGFNWGNAFGCDHNLTYQLTVSSNFHKFRAHSLNYTMPLPWRHILLIFGGYSTIHPDLSQVFHEMGVFKNDGHSSQGSARYQIPIGKLYGSSLKELVLGFDIKNTNNNIEFFANTESSLADGANPLITKTVNITQAVLGFNWGKESCKHKLTLNAEMYWSPGEIIGNQSNENFEELRLGAKNHYVYGRATVGDVYVLPYNFSLSGLFRGQFANQNLLPSEQFGLGGYNTVRGYEERAVNADNALLFNFELRTPPVSLFKFVPLTKVKKVRDDLIFLFFVDYGIGKNHKKFEDEEKIKKLLGIGPGLRYSINPYLSARIDFGLKMRKAETTDLKPTKIHAAILLSY